MNRFSRNRPADKLCPGVAAAAGPACASEDGLLWRKHKVGSAMLLFTLCVLGAVGAIL